MRLRLIHGWMIVLMVAVLGLGVLTPVLSNSLLLLMDRTNFIPAESSIWTFEPTLINQGSSSYWLYGEDQQYYFYFSYAQDQPYRLIAKTNRCPGFDKHEVQTWCAP
ncbi:hypothetical protein BS643_07710 [Pseudomonas protegens]|uniref:hypothetical protein n=1 Tax=Pseudomonas TaxID=286 RepID=UPI00037A83AB|nr:hypothetical protein [Pseudomonas protegens]MDX9683479.1 hypothetical protein [Pseudomonas protegens]NMZ28088.1 hypothetical protein [Pseudomonas protegens]NMZ89625.1 hypothetical protein [Pseudomonas protegens]OBZ24377.1 hypothetical protein BBH57_19720 [Pseudomonas protegens]OBZ28276.1 hypothetical protein BBH58_00735 [Pseudomonas protegens]